MYVKEGKGRKATRKPAMDRNDPVLVLANVKLKFSGRVGRLTQQSRDLIQGVVLGTVPEDLLKD